MIDPNTDTVVKNFECKILTNTYTVLQYANHNVQVLKDGIEYELYECDNGSVESPRVCANYTFNDIRNTLEMVRRACEVK